MHQQHLHRKFEVRKYQFTKKIRASQNRIIHPFPEIRLTMSIEALYEIFLAHPSVQTDTRWLRPGDIFFALKGPSFDGNAFAEAALKAGAAYAVVDNPTLSSTSGCILVEDVLQCLQQLARHHRRQLQIPVLAITGSNGKTTTKELITAVLRQKHRTHATTGNLNNHIGVPLTLLSIPLDCEFAVVEMGANHRGEIAAYCRIAEPTMGLITNVGKAHIEGFGGLEGVRLGKGELYDYIRNTQGSIFRNADLDYLEEMAQGVAKQVTYGSAPGADFRADIIGKDGLFLSLQLQQPKQALLHTQLVGTYNFANVMSAVALGLSQGVTIPEIEAALAAYQPDNSRSQWLRRGSNEVILDAYNANPTSMQAAIENFASSPLQHKRLWLGGMKEMGSDSTKEHRDLLTLADHFTWDELLIVGEEFQEMKAGRLWFPDSEAAAKYVLAQPPSGAAILIKGSRGSRMERLLEALPE